MGLFVNSGYLTISHISYAFDGIIESYELKIPNREVREEFKQITADYLNVEENIVNKMILFLKRKEIKKFYEEYARMILDVPSYYDLKNENSYHMFLLGIFTWLSLSYEIKSNREEGEGRYDIRLKSKNENDPHIIIEMKYTKNDKSDLKTLIKMRLQ